ncbi:hypothetical protein C1646_768512 [Rhizophagus diaphanus]|nr:hypothetical protein C1646_768512 [Rhizophagus diaphanus] [Rhizophagus sp. MUCL 43196]
MMFDTTNLLYDITALQLNHQKLYKSNNIKTDHLMVLNQFFAQEIIELKQLAKLKQQKKWKMIYAYDNMTEQDWLNYKEETAKLFVDENQSILQNINDLNKKWLNFLKLVSTVLPHDITPDNIAKYLHDLITINDLLIVQYKADLIQYKNTQIKNFMQNRYRVIVIENDKEILKTAPEYIDTNIYEGLMDYITQEEVDYHISILLNGKASGPSKISYEMIKHSSDEMKSRCSKIFKENNILKGNQFAGLEGNSTFEPIRIIKEIIQNAVENKNEL